VLSGCSGGNGGARQPSLAALQTAFGQVNSLTPPGAALDGEEVANRRGGVTIRTKFRLYADRVTTLKRLDQILTENGWAEDAQKKGTFRRQVADRTAELTVQLRNNSTLLVETQIDW
jgi:hypothetical protein